MRDANEGRLGHVIGEIRRRPALLEHARRRDANLRQRRMHSRWQSGISFRPIARRVIRRGEGDVHIVGKLRHERPQ